MSTVQKEGLRERKNRRTQESIVHAAAELTLQEGFAAATIPRIAELADVAPRTVSGWFPVKEDILFAGLSEIVARAVASLRDGDGDVVDRLIAWFTEEEARIMADRELKALSARAILSDPSLRARERSLLEPIAEELAAAAGRQVGEAPDRLGPQVFAAATMGFFQALRTRELAGGITPEERDDGIAVLRGALSALQARR